MSITYTEISIRLAVAALFGAIIGLERERKNWVAGLRTHMLVCVGAALTMMVSAYGFEDVMGARNIVLDPSRIAAQVISGIGFIGAGTILFLKQGIVRGLTTAAGLWTVAAIGLATGGGMYFAAMMTTALVLVILLIIQPLEKRFTKRFRHRKLKITTCNKAKSIQIVKEVLQGESSVSSCAVEKSEDQYILSFSFENINEPALLQLINTFQTDSDVQDVIWNR